MTRHQAAARAVLALILLVPLAGPGARADFQPRQHDCVGDPPRQTEDPLSPACVPFFDGDNGGSTYAGVTADEIRIVLYNDMDVKGDMNAPWTPEDENPAHLASANGQQTYLVRTIKAQLRYFQSRFQTYGRRVHVIASRSLGGLASFCSARQGDALTARHEIDPFGAAFLGANGDCFFSEFAKRFKLPSFAYGEDVPRKLLDELSPYVWAFTPDQNTEAAASASFICRKLNGRIARFSPDPSLQTSPRKFGLIFPMNDQRAPHSAELAEMLQQKVRTECGLDFSRVEGISDGGQREAAQILASFKLEGITTVVCYCIPVQTEMTVMTMQSVATGLAYFPEWYWDHASRMDKPMWQQTYGSKVQRSFGTSNFWRQPNFRSQWHYQAYRSQEPGTEPNARFNWDIYHMFLQLFTAIQMAGSNLTPESIRDGLFTHSRPSTSPFQPGASYGHSGPGRYSFVDDQMAWWWDPAGTEPGGRQGAGCLRVYREGARFRAGAWPEGDEDLITQGAPCTAAPQRALPV